MGSSNFLDNYYALENEGVSEYAPSQNYEADDNFLDRYYIEEQKQRDAQIQTLLNSVADNDPDGTGEAQRLARYLGLPEGMTIDSADTLETLREKQRERLRQAHSLAMVNPILARQLSDPSFAAIAHDNLPRLAAHEKLWKGITSVPRDGWQGLHKGHLSKEMGLIADRLRGNKAQLISLEEGFDPNYVPSPQDLEDYKRLKEISEIIQNYNADGVGLIEGAGYFAGQFGSSFPEAATAGLGTWWLQTSVGGATGWQLGGNLEGGAHFPGSRIIFGSGGATVGNFVGLFTGWNAFQNKLTLDTWAIEGGHSWLDLRKNGANMLQADITSNAIGFTNAAIEKWGLGVVGGPYGRTLGALKGKFARSGLGNAPLVQTIKRRIFRQVTKNALSTSGKKLTWNAITQQFGREWVTLIGTEMMQEIAQEMVAITGNNVLAGLSEEEIATISAEEAADRIWSTATETAKGMILFGLIGPGITYSSNLSKAQKARDTTAVLEKITEISKDDATKGRNKEAYQNYEQQLGDQAGVSDFYFNAEVFQQQLDNNAITEQQLELFSPELVQQLRDAKKEGSVGKLVKIPTGKYLAEISGTELGNALFPHLKPGENEYSQTEMIQFYKDQPQLLAAAREEIQQNKEILLQSTRESRLIKKQIAGQLAALNLPKITPRNAVLLAGLPQAFAETYSKYLGITPAEFINQYQYNIRGSEIDSKTFSKQFYNQDGTIKTETQLFKNWFRKSTLTNPDGTPQVVYHGTTDSFDYFDLDHQNRYDSGFAGTGIYLTPNEGLAKHYAQKKSIRAKGEKKVLKLYARLENPKIESINIKPAMKEGGRVKADGYRDKLIAEGHDGVIVKSEAGEVVEIVVFDVNGVKSIDNKGSWSNEINNMYEQKVLESFEQRGKQKRGRQVPQAVYQIATLVETFDFAGQKQYATNRDFKVAIQERIKAEAKKAGVDLSGDTTEVEKYLVQTLLADAKFALETNPNAVGWYNEKVTKALSILSKIHPEIATDPQSKFAFIWALANTSNGLKVDKNFELAEKAYAYYSKNGVMPTDIGIGDASAAINNNMKLFNKLLEEKGFEDFEQFMKTMHTVKDVEAYTGSNVSGENKTEMVYGAAVMGPKIGNGFFANLYGNFEQLTMDRWLMRTWGRMTGTLITDYKKQAKTKREQLKPLIKGLTLKDKKAFEAIIGIKIKLSNLDEVAIAIQKASQKPANRKAMAQIATIENETNAALITEVLGEPKKNIVRIGIGDELRKGGNALAKFIDGQKESPSGPVERRRIRKVFNQALSILQQSEKSLTMADLQALIWYPEKRLYDSAKLDSSEQNTGYQDNEAPDYSNAAINLAQQFGVSDADIQTTLQEVDNELERQAVERTRGSESGEGTGGIVQGADTQGRIDEATGLPLNPDGTVTVYHHTDRKSASRIESTGELRSAGEPDVYVTTRAIADTGYGDTAVAIRVEPSRLSLDDEFPNGRRDFRLSVGEPRGSIRVKVGEYSQQPEVFRQRRDLTDEEKYGIHGDKWWKRRVLDAANFIGEGLWEAEQKISDKYYALRERMDGVLWDIEGRQVEKSQERIQRELAEFNALFEEGDLADLGWRDIPEGQTRRRTIPVGGVARDGAVVVERTDLTALQHIANQKGILNKIMAGFVLATGKLPHSYEISVGGIASMDNADLRELGLLEENGDLKKLSNKEQVNILKANFDRVRAELPVGLYRMHGSSHSRRKLYHRWFKNDPDVVWVNIYTGERKTSSYAAKNIDDVIPHLLITDWTKTYKQQVFDGTADKGEIVPYEKAIDAEVIPAADTELGKIADEIEEIGNRAYQKDTGWMPGKPRPGRLSDQLRDMLKAATDADAKRLRALDQDLKKIQKDLDKKRLKQQVFHGTSPEAAALIVSTGVDFSSKDYGVMGEGFYVTTDRDYATVYGPEIIEGMIPDSAKILDITGKNAFQWAEEVGIGKPTESVDMESHIQEYFSDEQKDQIVQWAKDNNYDGIKFDPNPLVMGVERTADEALIPEIVLFNKDLADQIVKVQEDFFKQDAARGQFEPTTLTAILTQEADFSTFAHETAHYMLSVLENIVSTDNAPQELVADFNTLLKFWGVKDLETWQGFSMDQKREYHEAFAYNFELYLFEGKAPSKDKGMLKLFKEFKKFIKAVYQDVSTRLNELYKKETGKDLPILTNEVRSVMDRMLATDEQIVQANQIYDMKAMFQTQEQSGMNDAEWAAYQASLQEAEDESIAIMTQQSMRQVRWLNNARSKVLAKLQKDKKKLYKEVEAEVIEEIKQDKRYKLQWYLKRGETYNDKGEVIKVEGDYKLSIDSLRNLVPFSDMEAEIKQLTVQRMAGKKGQDVKLVADMFGFTDPLAMIEALLTLQPLKEAIAERTQQRMLEEHSGLVDERELELQVQEAIHNEARARFIAIELNALSKAMKPVRFQVEAARQVAQEILAGKKLSEIRPSEFTRAEARAVKATEAAMKGKDQDSFKEAIRAKRSQLLNNQLAKEAIEVHKEYDKATKGRNATFKKFFRSDKQLSNKSHPRNTDLINAGRVILASYGVGPTVENINVFTENLRKYDEQLYAELEPVILDASASEGQKDLTDLTYEEFLDLRDLALSLWHQSRRAEQVRLTGELEELQPVKDKLNNRQDEIINSNKKLRERRDTPVGTTKAVPKLYVWNKYLLEWGAKLRRMEPWVDEMDGASGLKEGVGSAVLELEGGKLGNFYNYLWFPMKSALDEYRIQQTIFTKQYSDLVGSIDFGDAEITANEFEFVSEESEAYTFGTESSGRGRVELLGALLHTGNASNKRKLLLGRKWGKLNEDGSLDSTHWDAFEKRMQDEGHLTKDDYDFVQAVWDLNEKMLPLLQRAHRDTEGYYFKTVEATPIFNRFGEFRGGYVPAKGDPNMTEVDLKDEINTAKSEFKNSLPKVQNGMTKERIESFAQPLSLHLNYMTKHIDDTLRYAYIQPVLQDILKLVNDKEFTKKLKIINPVIKDEMIIPWLKAAASQKTYSPSGLGAGADAVISTGKRRTGIGIMFGNFSNAFQQLTGLFPGLLKVKPNHLRHGLMTYMKDREGTNQMIAEMSPFMADRQKNLIFDIQGRLNELLVNPNNFQKMQNWGKTHGYFLQQTFQGITDAIVWMGTYNQVHESMPSSMSDQEVMKEAVKQADANVRMTQDSLLPEDRAAFQNMNPIIQSLMQFTGYFNMIANLGFTQYQKLAKNELGFKNKGKNTEQLFYLWLYTTALPAVIAGIIMRGLGGRLGEDEDEDGYIHDDMAKAAFGDIVGYMAGLVPIAGQVLLVPINQFNNKPWDDDIVSSPSVEALQDALRSIPSLVETVFTDGEFKGKQIRDVSTLINLGSGIPVTPLGRMLGYLRDVQRGYVTPKGPIDFVRGVVTGKAGAGK